MKKIVMVSLGCPKNLVESELIVGTLENTFEITDKVNEADYIIINTCGFIESAKQESIDTILDVYAKKKNENVKLLVTGCLAKRYKDIIKNDLPEVDEVVDIGDINSIFSILEEDKGKDIQMSYENRKISTGTSYAYLRISDGCDNRCTYCAIPDIRGPYKSREFDEIVSEASLLATKGIKEIIIVAQDTTFYGVDLYGKRRLAELIQKISEIEDIKWIRLMYAYPEQIDDELIDLFVKNKKLCNYIDLPIQHISDNILKKMGRKGTSAQIKGVIEKMRQKVPEISIRTTFIVGFPGETDEDFEVLEQFIKKARFDRMGVFTYSKEEGTPAAKMKNQISKKIKNTRYDKLMVLQKQISEQLNKQRLNKIYSTIVEGVSEDGLFYYGRSYAEAPDIDVNIYFTSEEPLVNGQIVNVKILNTEEYDLIGAICNET